MFFLFSLLFLFCSLSYSMEKMEKEGITKRASIHNLFKLTKKTETLGINGISKPIKQGHSYQDYEAAKAAYNGSRRNNKNLTYYEFFKSIQRYEDLPEKKRGKLSFNKYLVSNKWKKEINKKRKRKKV